MGNCCSKKHLTKKKAFHQELGVPLLESLAPELGKHAKVVVVRLVGLDHISSTSNYTRGANAFVRFRLLPADEVGGEQEQSSTIVPGTSTPLWEPPERFQFIISDMKKSRLLISVYHYDETRPKENFPIGDAVAKLDTLGLTEEAVDKTFNLTNPSNGKTEGEAMLRFVCLAPEDALRILEESVFEFQSCRVFTQWEALASPGRWSTADGKKFTETLEAAAAPVNTEEGWTVVNTWNIMSTQDDPDGWQYATALDSPFWHPKNTSSLFVFRRRTWHRTLQRWPSGSTPSPLGHHDPPSSASPAGGSTKAGDVSPRNGSPRSGSPGPVRRGSFDANSAVGVQRSASPSARAASIYNATPGIGGNTGRSASPSARPASTRSVPDAGSTNSGAHRRPSLDRTDGSSFRSASPSARAAGINANANARTTSNRQPSPSAAASSASAKRRSSKK